MKLVRNNKVYIQKKDLFVLLNGLNLYKIDINKSIFNNLFSKKIESDSMNDYDYICFDDEESVNLFKNIDFIADYDEANSLSEDELREFIISNINKVNLLAIKRNRIKRYDFNKKLKVDCSIDLLNEKTNDLISILNEKQGRIVLNIPNGDISLSMEK